MLVLFAAGCARTKDFEYGVEQINSLNSKYNTTMETYPKSTGQIELMIGDFKEIKQLQLDSGQQPFGYVIDYRLLNLEAEKLFIESQKYGARGTTKDGFGCKSRPLILESAGLRNMSALKGFEAVGLLRDFADKYPEESVAVGLTYKNALFLNATFYQISKDARSDSSIINNFCPENVTLEIYQQEIRKSTNLSEDFISRLDYNGAVDIWKKIRGIE